MVLVLSLISVVLHVSDAQFRPFLQRGGPLPRNWFTPNGLPAPIPGQVVPPNFRRFPVGVRNTFIPGVLPRTVNPNLLQQARLPPDPFGFRINVPPALAPRFPQLPIGTRVAPGRVATGFRTPFSPLNTLTGIIPTQTRGTQQPVPTLATPTNNAGSQPTPPRNLPESLTFNPLSGAQSPVTITSSDVDTLYARVKAIFDRAFPDLPPLRRTNVRVLFQLQRSPTLVDATAVLSNDLSTLYVPYQIPDRSDIAFIPFDRTTKELKYPSRAILLPYPLLTVQVGERNFPVYLPFQPDSSRPPNVVPRVFIPFENPPEPIADYVVFVPFVPEALSNIRGRVTAGRNFSDPNILAGVPKTERDAAIQGFSMISDCSGNFLGRRYIQNKDSSLILIYDVNGVIAGIQTGIPVGLVGGYPTENLIPRPFVPEGSFLYLTTYFIEPGKICTTGRNRAEVSSIGTGTDLYLQNGFDPIKDSVIVPRNQSDLQNTLWTPGRCYPGQGTHFSYNLRPDMPCEELVPIHLIYNRGRLKGFAFIFLSQIQSAQKRYENYDKDYFSAIYRTMPSCLYKAGPITSLHVFLVDNPLMHQC
ncbi:hypothetical protein FSP39_006639 [Pinctada imbricata]|uniref:Uncharacterized protein n=1 Tax=Pinctada imbricata TaxID=66713 RepID=A0AA88Y8C5_PINIB|nr:hypothetical protein FSP39_006639 [Pinctada imbricata]